MANPRQARLIVRDGVPDPRTINLVNQRHELGRWPHPDIALDNPLISRRHAEIEYTDSGFVIRDLGSRNGTSVNGIVLDDRPRKIRAGDIIEFAEGRVVSVFSVDTSNVQTELPGSNPVPAPIDSPAIPRRGLFVDVGAREVYVDGEIVDPPCGRKQFDILAMMYERRGEACSKDSIAAAGWAERLDGGVSDGEIGAMMHRLRRRINPGSDNRKFIETVTGYGYRLNVDG